MDQELYRQKQARLATILESLQRDLGDIPLSEFLEYVRSKQVAEQEAAYFSIIAQQSEDAMTVIEMNRERE